jgi:hypothetical protein
MAFEIEMPSERRPATGNLQISIYSDYTNVQKHSLGQTKTPSFVLRAELATSVAMDVTFILGILDLLFPLGTSCSSGIAIRGE